jgi:microsomal dipeptidase-like Zn-dependent dipeptidase
MVPPMRLRGAFFGCLTFLVLALPAAASAGDNDRYALANGCYALKSNATGKYAAKGPNSSYGATGGDVAGGEPFRMKATELGAYMLYGKAGDFFGASGDRAVIQPQPDANADWRVTGTDGNFRLTLPDAGKALAVDGAGNLVLVPADGAGDKGIFSFDAAQGCATFPEVETNVTGEPSKGAYPFGETRGLLDGHMHMMAFEFLGGRVHCGKPWDRFGVTVALVDCPDHYGNGAGAVLENTISYGNPARTHDPIGWPTFRDWPAAPSLTHEQSYYKWTERAWRSGLRLYVNLLVDNNALCTVYPLKKNSCNEMDSVRLQAQDLYQLQNYIDAQNGGPGKGWMRIVKTPFEARKVINEGKLAIVMGIEVSRLFDCREFNDVAQCDDPQIDRQLDEVYKLGVRDMELVNKFDNALGGVAGDEGTTGTAVNQANKEETGHYWEMQTCDSLATPDSHDRNQIGTQGTGGRDELVGGILNMASPIGAVPVYPDPPHCNAKGLSPLGEHLVRKMMEKKMIIDPDHLSVRARDHLLSIVESQKYSGIISSHSWSTPDAFPRIYKLGGMVTPYAGDSTKFVDAWRKTKPMADPRFYFGFGWGADMNGFGHQGNPRGANAPNPVTYPFKSFDGKQTIDKQRSGERVYDINVDGVAHYGLYPDWLEDLRKLAGNEIVNDMARGPEAYLQMWERADGVPAASCVQSRVKFLRTGFTRMRLGDTPEKLLRRAGQPASRPGRAWSYCSGRGDGGTVTPILDANGKLGVIVSAARFHRSAGIGPGARSSRLRGRKFKRFGRGVYVRSAGRGSQFVYVVKKGRVTHAGVASKAAARSPKVLRDYLAQAGL